MAEQEASPPSAWFCLAVAVPPAVIWYCFLPIYNLAWWLPISIAVPYLPLPESVPVLGLLHLYATYDAIVEAEWSSSTWFCWLKIISAMFLLAKAMGLTHESIWDALEPALIGREGHGAGRRRAVPQGNSGRKPDMLDKDGRPLGSQSVLVPGTQLQIDVHDGGGFRPFIIPGEPTFPSERRAIEAFFTKEEHQALKEASIRPWDPSASKVLTKERFESVREEHGLWRELA